MVIIIDEWFEFHLFFSTLFFFRPSSNRLEEGKKKFANDENFHLCVQCKKNFLHHDGDECKMEYKEEKNISSSSK
jgi:hypothetical protein